MRIQLQFTVRVLSLRVGLGLDIPHKTGAHQARRAPQQADAVPVAPMDIGAELGIELGVGQG